MKNYIKIIFALALCFVMVFSFAACGNVKKTVLVISGTEIDNEIFTYYLDKVIHRPSDYGLEEKTEKKLLKKTAIDECKKYCKELRNVVI